MEKIRYRRKVEFTSDRTAALWGAKIPSGSSLYAAQPLILVVKSSQHAEANPLPRKQMVGGYAIEGAGQNARPSLVYMCSGAGNGTRTRDPLLGKNDGSGE